MRIESKFLKEFVKKATVDGKIDEMRMNFTERGIEFIENDKANYYLCQALLKKTAFKTYEQIGEIAINNTKRFQNFIDRFDSEIDLTKEGVSLKMKGKGRNCNYILASVESMPQKVTFPKFEFKFGFDVESTALNNAITNANRVSKETDLNFSTDNSKLIITTGKDDKFEEIVDVPAIKEKMSSNFGEPLKEVIPVLDGKINIAMAEKGPMKIAMRSEFDEFVYFIAPKIPEDEEVKGEEE